jgi:hypothetical protein
MVRRRLRLGIEFVPKKFCVGYLRLAQGGIRHLYFTLPLQNLLPLIRLGMDGTQKIIQYAMKVYLLFHLAIFRRMPVQGAKKRAFENALLQRLQSTVSGLSLTRCVPTMRGSGSVLRLGRLNQKVPYHV